MGETTIRGVLTPAFYPAEQRAPVQLAPSVGERNSSAVLTTDKVRAIRAAADAGGNVRMIGAAFGISERAARHIARRTSWTHVS